MRTAYQLKTAPGTVLRWDYQHLMASAIYSGMKGSPAGDELHDSSGFKHFCYCLSVTKRRATRDGLVLLDGNAQLIVSAVKSETMNMIKEALADEIRLGDAVFAVGRTDDRVPPEIDGDTVYTLLTPAVATRLENEKTRVIDPLDSEYKIALLRSMKNKAAQLSLDSTGDRLDIIDIPKNSLTRIFKNSPVKGSVFSFMTDMKPETMAVLMDSGIGAKGSVGFGFVGVERGATQ